MMVLKRQSLARLVFVLLFSAWVMVDATSPSTCAAAAEHNECQGGVTEGVEDATLEGNHALLQKVGAKMSMGAAVVEMDSKDDGEGDSSKQQQLLELNNRKQKLLEELKEVHREELLAQGKADETEPELLELALTTEGNPLEILFYQPSGDEETATAERADPMACLEEDDEEDEKDKEDKEDQDDKEDNAEEDNQEEEEADEDEDEDEDGNEDEDVEDDAKEEKDALIQDKEATDPAEFQVGTAVEAPADVQDVHDAGESDASLISADGADSAEEKGPNPAMKKVLDRHNQYRCMHGLPHFKWSDAIAGNSLSWAKKTGGQMKHSSSGDRKGVGGFSYLGENLAWGAFDERGVDLWYDEIKYTNGGKVSSFGHKTGHYTQVVWKASTHLGCGVEKKLLVCQYGPGGNMGGQFGSNVNGPTKSKSQCPEGAGASPGPAPPPRMPVRGRPAPRPPGPQKCSRRRSSGSCAQRRRSARRNPRPSRRPPKADPKPPHPRPMPRPQPSGSCLAKSPSFQCKGRQCLPPQYKKYIDRIRTRSGPFCMKADHPVCKRKDQGFCRGQCNCPNLCPHACGRCPKVDQNRLQPAAPMSKPNNCRGGG